MSEIDRLAELHGILHEYYDYEGKHRLVSAQTKRGLLRAMGVPVDDEAAMRADLARLRDGPWLHTLPPVAVLREGEPAVIEVTVSDRHLGQSLHWLVELEDGGQRSGQLPLNHDDAGERKRVGEVERVRYPLRLPSGLPLGYHKLRVLGTQRDIDARARLIVAPLHCHVPESLQRGASFWGLAVQLYTLHSQRVWGIGDFGELAASVRQAAAAGAHFVGLNPLHALYPARPAHSSPYSPSSRIFLNVLYIDVTAVAEYAACDGAQALVDSEQFQQRLRSARAEAHVDYVAAGSLKLPVLKKLYRQFAARELARNTERAQAFEHFVAQGGEALRVQGLFDALYAHFHERDPSVQSWTQWPEAYRDLAGAAVRHFEREAQDSIRFYQYLQFVADEQLGAAQAAALSSGMAVGLYRDLAVGVDSAGAEAWANHALYCLGASVGAPPDALALQGQDWGLPPQDPRVLRARAYEDFAGLLRANMRHCGALRIDHVMALMRLWWVPEGMGADHGAYVRYPLEDLLGILALESQRNRCLVIGEDLGTVPDEIREALSAARVLSYRVLIFEKNADGNFKPPDAYPHQALATATTHDLPTLCGYWERHDLALRERLGLFPTQEIRDRCYREREEDRAALLRALAMAELLPAGASVDPASYPRLPWSLAAALQVFLASSAAALTCLQPEDWLELRDPVNLPGTSTEHRNWSRKLTASFDELFARSRVQALCGRLNRARAQLTRP